MRRTTRRKLLAALLAAGLLATTPAFAKPIDRIDRSDPPTSTISSPGHPSQDLRGEHARDAARVAPPISRPPVYWSYEYQAPTPKPVAAHSTRPVSPDDGLPWITIVVGVAGIGLLAGSVYVTTRALRAKVA